MTKTPSFPLLEHPAFCGVSDASVSRLERECSVFRFELGAQLSEPNEIPARILVILQGQAGRTSQRPTHHGGEVRPRQRDWSGQSSRRFPLRERDRR